MYRKDRRGLGGSLERTQALGSLKDVTTDKDGHFAGKPTARNIFGATPPASALPN